MEWGMLNADAINLHHRRRDIRIRLMTVLRALAGIQKQGNIAQVFFDLASNVDGSVDHSRLPATPDGFVVKQTTILKNSGRLTFKTLCLYQVVSMAVLYYRLYGEMHDDQDARSCGRYLNWLERYVSAPLTYAVTGNVRDGYWLYQPEACPDGKPILPEWLGENEGETV